MMRLFAMVALVLLATGCFRDITPYPSGWVPLDPHPTCSAITGKYKAYVGDGYVPAVHGVGRYGDLGWLLSASELFGIFCAPEIGLFLSGPDTLVVQCPQKELRFDTVRKDSLVTYGKSECNDGKVVLTRKHPSGSYIGPEWIKDTIVLTRSVDGWLVVESDRREVGLLGYVVPLVGSSVEWYHFEPVRETSTPAH